jgi:hypothetical protein
MITGNWGTVRGVFYPDGTVRDPSIPAALLGFFRNRGKGVVEEVPDRENHLSPGTAWAIQRCMASRRHSSPGRSLAVLSKMNPPVILVTPDGRSQNYT